MSGSPCIGAVVNGTATPELVEAEDWQFYTKLMGSACTHLSDFTERAGTLFVTNRVEVSVDYVLHPGEPGSIELTSAATYMARKEMNAEAREEFQQMFYSYSYSMDSA